MAKFHFLLACSELTLVLGHPGGAIKRQSIGLGTALDISSNTQVTTSWSTAIEGLQSATASATPTITGVCIASLHSTVRSFIADKCAESRYYPSSWWYYQGPSQWTSSYRDR
jgi:hypothetical protein